MRLLTLAPVAGRPVRMIFAADAAELHKQEIARLSDPIVPRLETMWRMAAIDRCFPQLPFKAVLAP